MATPFTRPSRKRQRVDKDDLLAIMEGGSVSRVAVHPKEAGLQDWLKWFAQPFQVIWKHHREFVQGPVDDAVDAIIKDLAPALVRAIGEKEVEEDLTEFTDGAFAGKWDRNKGNLASPPPSESRDFAAGYAWGYEHADEFRNNLPPAVKREIIERALAVYRKTITEEVLERALKQVWSAINPKHTFQAIVKAVKKHGWKLGIGFALFEVFEHFALPALLAKVTGDPKLLALATLPIGEVIYAVVFRILGRTPEPLDNPSEDGHLDWYEQNFGKIRLASSFPTFDQWQSQRILYKHADLAPPLGYPGGVCHTVQRIEQEVPNERLQDKLQDKIEDGRELSNAEAHVVYPVEMERGPWKFKKLEILSHAQYRMDLRSITVPEVRTALDSYFREWNNAKSRQDPWATSQAELLARGQPVEWTDPRTNVKVVFTTRGQGSLRVITVWRPGERDPTGHACGAPWRQAAVVSQFIEQVTAWTRSG